ncbi:MAG: hypothetical protein WCL03_11735 [Bacteroidota bacterium]
MAESSRIQDAGCRMQDAGSRMQDAGCRIQDPGSARSASIPQKKTAVICNFSANHATYH